MIIHPNGTIIRQEALIPICYLSSIRERENLATYCEMIANRARGEAHEVADQYGVKNREIHEIWYPKFGPTEGFPSDYKSGCDLNSMIDACLAFELSLRFSIIIYDKDYFESLEKERQAKS